MNPNPPKKCASCTEPAEPGRRGPRKYCRTCRKEVQRIQHQASYRVHYQMKREEDGGTPCDRCIVGRRVHGNSPYCSACNDVLNTMILRMVDAGYLLFEDIAAEVGLTKDAVYQRVCRLRRKGTTDGSPIPAAH